MVCTGRISSAETGLEAAMREVIEELVVDTDFVQLFKLLSPKCEYKGMKEWECIVGFQETELTGR